MPTQETLLVILAGGFSSRMGQSKALISYYGQSQVHHLLGLANELHLPAVISCRKEQQPDFPDMPLLFDVPAYSGHGPVSGLLSAHHEHPGSDILLLGCDYPLLRAEHLLPLMQTKNDVHSAVCWKKTPQSKPEPLPALYRNAAIQSIAQRFELGQFSLRDFLSQEQTLCLLPNNADFLQSIDTPEQYKQIFDSLHK